MLSKRCPCLIVFALSLMFLATSFIQAFPLTDETSIAAVAIEAGGVTWLPHIEYGSLVLTISAPGGEVYRAEFPRGVNPSFHLIDKNGHKRPDGQYIYELRLIPAISQQLRDTLQASRENGNSKAVVQELQAQGQLPAREVVQSGSFVVAQGAVISNNGAEAPQQSAKSLSPLPGQKATSEGGPINDQVIPDDLIVQGSGCFGLDCVNNESFGFDTLRLKENNTRLSFVDTSTAVGRATRDWRLRANESTAGGMNAFFIDDLGDNSNGSEAASSTPFTILAGAPTNSIFLDGTGKLGLHTATPGLDIHINTGNTPAIRFEQNAGNGFTAQTWDIGANEANFFVRDLTGGSSLPFRIRPGAPTSSIDISASGRVGIGTSSPAAKLDISAARADASASGLRITDLDNNVSTPVANLYDSQGFGQLDLFTTASVQDVQIRAGGVSFLNGGNVGIGTSTPNFKLDVAGTVNATAYYLNGAPVTSAFASGTGTQNRIAKWVDNAGKLGDSIMTESGSKIGIGTTSPSSSLGGTALHVAAVGGNAATLRIENTSGRPWEILTGNAGFFEIKDVTAGTDRFLINPAGNIGIGTFTPHSSLEVNGYVQLALTSGAPPAVDCDDATEYGRMKVDATGNKLYVCTSTGWKTAVLTP